MVSSSVHMSDARDVKVLLMIYRAYCTSSELFSFLTARFEVPALKSSATEEQRTNYAERIVSRIKMRSSLSRFA